VYRCGSAQLVSVIYVDAVLTQRVDNKWVGVQRLREAQPQGLEAGVNGVRVSSFGFRCAGPVETSEDPATTLGIDLRHRPTLGS